MDKNRELKDQELEEANGGANVNIWDIAVKLKDTKPVVKSSGPLNPAIDKKDIPTDEETWLA